MLGRWLRSLQVLFEATYDDFEGFGCVGYCRLLLAAMTEIKCARLADLVRSQLFHVTKSSTQSSLHRNETFHKLLETK